MFSYGLVKDKNGIPHFINLYEMYDKLNKEFFNNELPRIQIYFNKKIRKVLGRTFFRLTLDKHKSYKAYKIDISSNIIVEAIEEVLKHEMIHVKFPNDGHGFKFQTECIKIGIRPSKMISKEKSKMIKNHTHELYCENCNRVLRKYYRKPNRNINYSCNYCGGKKYNPNFILGIRKNVHL